jgi:hypothetical protein
MGRKGNRLETPAFGCRLLNAATHVKNHGFSRIWVNAPLTALSGDLFHRIPAALRSRDIMSTKSVDKIVIN